LNSRRKAIALSTTTLLSHSRLSSFNRCVLKPPFEPNQFNLFSDLSFQPVSRPATLVMDKPALVRWKSQIYDYQQRAKASQPVQQTALFDLTPAHCDPDSIDPFALQLHPSEFYRLPDNDSEACLDFIIDNTLPILLYVGETKRTPSQWWKGIHDAKGYVANYVSLNCQYKLDVAVVAAFWWDVPADTRPRQQLELILIQKWRSPFNRENWQWYGQPFG